MQPLHENDPPRIGPFQLTHRLGAGGMGQVYLARTRTGRDVVVKVIRPEHLNESKDETFRARFTREAEAARLVDGRYTSEFVAADPEAEAPWIASMHIPGPSLARAVTEHGPLTEPALRALAAGLAEGLQAIHSCDLVHRDLKPGNIILAEDGPRIIDFGITHQLGSSPLTSTGRAIGTPAYLSPEQAKGKQISPASDVFSLGTVLSFAATGANPFDAGADNLANIVWRLLNPATAPEGLPGALRELVDECWNQNPRQRPTVDRILATVGHLGTDQSWPPQHLRHHRPPTSTMEIPGEPTAHETSMAPTHPHGVAPAQEEDAPAPPANRHGEISHPPSPATLLGHTDKVGALAFSPDGSALATASGDSTTRLWTPHTGHHLHTLSKHSGWVKSVAFSPDSKTLATASADHTARLWNARTGRLRHALTGHTGSVESVAFSPDGATLATTSTDHTARLWNTRTGKLRHTLTEHTNWMGSVAFSPEGTTLATTSDDHTARLWNPHTGELLHTLTGHYGPVGSVAFSPDGILLATTSWDNTARLWDAHGGELLHTLTGHTDRVDSLAFSPDGTSLATASWDNTARLWNPHTGELLHTLIGHTNSVASVAYNPDGTTLATASWDYTAGLWDAHTGQYLHTLSGHTNSVASAAYSPDGATLATTSQDQTARLWRIRMA